MSTTILSQMLQQYQLLRSSQVKCRQAAEGRVLGDRGDTPFGIANFRFQIVNLRFEISSVAKTRWPTRQRPMDRIRKSSARGMTDYVTCQATYEPRSEFNQSPVRQAHGPEVLEGKKSSLMSIRPRQIPVSSMNQQLTFSVVVDRQSKCR